LAFFFSLTLLFLALYVRRPRALTLYAAACSAGLAFLAKETAILMVPCPARLFHACPRRAPQLRDFRHIRTRIRADHRAVPALAGVGGRQQGRAGVLHLASAPPLQSRRRLFYLSVVPSIGIPLVALALLGLVLALRRRKGLDVLIVSLTVVVVAFFELWPVKGFQYLIPLITPLALRQLMGSSG